MRENKQKRAGRASARPAPVDDPFDLSFFSEPSLPASSDGSAASAAALEALAELEGLARVAKPSRAKKAPARAEPEPPAAEREPEPPPAPTAPARVEPPPEDTRLFLGDHVELGRRLVGALTVSGVPPVFSRNALWRYDELTGTWARCEYATAFNAVARMSGSLVGGESVLELRATDVHGAVSCAQMSVSSPAFFDAAPDVVCCGNGVLRADATGSVELVPHDPELRCLHSLGCLYDPRATSPLFDRYLDTTFADLPIEERAKLVDTLAEFVGACLFGAATRYQSSLFLVGSGDNGKSVLLGVIRSLFPRSSISAIPPQEWDNWFHRAELAGKAINLVAELPDRELIDSDSFKAVISGDELQAAEKRQQPFKFVPRAGHVFACNDLPPSRDATTGFWRRPIVVPFTRRIPASERIRELDKLIAQTELSGILAWAVAGFGRLTRRGHYDPPTASEAAKAEWRTESNVVLLFLRDAAEIDPSGEIRASTLYKAFVQWTKENGHHPLSSTAFGKRLVHAGVERFDDKFGRAYRLSLRRPETLGISPLSLGIMRPH